MTSIDWFMAGVSCGLLFLALREAWRRLKNWRYWRKAEHLGPMKPGSFKPRKYATGGIVPGTDQKRFYDLTTGAPPSVREIEWTPIPTQEPVPILDLYIDAQEGDRDEELARIARELVEKGLRDRA